MPLNPREDINIDYNRVPGGGAGFAGVVVVVVQLSSRDPSVVGGPLETKCLRCG